MSDEKTIRSGDEDVADDRTQADDASAAEGPSLTRAEALGAGTAAVAGLAMGQLAFPAGGSAASSSRTAGVLPLEERIERAVLALSKNPKAVNALLPASTTKENVLNSLNLRGTKRFDPHIHDQLVQMMHHDVVGKSYEYDAVPGSDVRTVEWVAALATLAAGALAA